MTEPIWMKIADTILGCQVNLPLKKNEIMKKSKTKQTNNNELTDSVTTSGENMNSNLPHNQKAEKLWLRHRSTTTPLPPKAQVSVSIS